MLRSFRFVPDLRKFLRLLGPGFIAGSSDDDASGIGTYSQAGAQFGYSQLSSGSPAVATRRRAPTGPSASRAGCRGPALPLPGRAQRCARCGHADCNPHDSRGSRGRCPAGGHPPGPGGRDASAGRCRPAWRVRLCAVGEPCRIRAGFTGFHALRHYYASLLIRHGESVKTVQARLGHASAVETLDTYSHLWPDSDDRTRDAIDSVLGTAYRLRTGKPATS